MKSILRTAAAIAAVASSAVAHAQYYCPPGSAYYASNYGSSCTLGTCWATSPFSGSQSAAPLGWPGWYYSCATDGPPPPPPPAGRIYYFKYDNQSNVKSVDGPLTGTADTTTNTYDAMNRLSRVTDPNAGQVNYGYDALDQLVSVSDPRSLVTSYSVNGLGNLNQQVSPDTGTTANTYDAAGNLLTSTDAKSQVTTYAYDTLNRVSSITYQGGATHVFQYDQGSYGKGRLTQITEPNSTTQYVYDQKGRLVSETRTINAVVYATGYSYDSAGRLSGMTYPSGRTVAYALDSLGRVQSIVTGTQTVVSAVSYYPFGAVEGFSFGNGQAHSRGIDQDGRVAGYSLGAQSFAVGHDEASRIAFISETGNPSNSNTYGYDLLDRLTQAVVPGTSYAYGYDATGNRLSRTAGSSTDTYILSGTSNRISSITPPSGPVRSYTHDANGSVTADGVNTYTYDTRGRLTQSVSVIGTTTYQVNALGQRIRKTSSLGDTVYHYDWQGRLIAETSPAGVVRREYLHLGDLPVAVADAAGLLYYIHPDHLNTPRLVADATGTTVWRWDQQEPFGVNVPDENPSSLGAFEFPMRFPGQYADKETGLHYNYFRDYDPSLGRYAESDPIGLVGGLNTYAYVGGDPVSHVDATGEAYALPLVVAGGVIVVAAAYYGIQGTISAIQQSKSSDEPTAGNDTKSCPAPCDPPEGTRCWEGPFDRKPHGGVSPNWKVYQMQRRRSGNNECYWRYLGGTIGVGVFPAQPQGMRECSTYPNFTGRGGR